MKNNLFGISGLFIDFHCPLFWHELRTNEYNLGRGAQSEKERICYVCSKKVVSVESKEKLLGEMKKGNCVSFVYAYVYNGASQRENKNGLVTIKKRATGIERDLIQVDNHFFAGEMGYDPTEPTIIKNVMFEDYRSGCSNYG